MSTCSGFADGERAIGGSSSSRHHFLTLSSRKNKANQEMHFYKVIPMGAQEILPRGRLLVCSRRHGVLGERRLRSFGGQDMLFLGPPLLLNAMR